MKIIKPEYISKKVEEKPNIEKILGAYEKMDKKSAVNNDNIGCVQIDYKQEALIDDNTKVPIEYNTKVPIEYLMQSVINSTPTKDKIKVEFYLTQRQYKLWQKKGEVAWLKKALLGQKYKK